jgi:hypothetical protein
MLIGGGKRIFVVPVTAPTGKNGRRFGFMPLYFSWQSVYFGFSESIEAIREIFGILNMRRSRDMLFWWNMRRWKR